MANLALYRKYRSRDFDELVGQNHITTSLENALKNGRISHAYLFSGPRGTGKTSTARILARRLNDVSADDKADQLDIIEIDAASNRRIDEIRDLRAKVHAVPTHGKYKVYIIDEVHMLTTEAFNALLKTLEEPPAHVIFILATTEPHKLPETIISRTQSYSFRPATVIETTAHLASIAKSEKIKIAPEALELIALAGKGSFRDSISILDQLANTESDISIETVTKVLGLANQSQIEELLVAITNSRVSTVLEIFDGFLDKGIDGGQFLVQILNTLRHILRVQMDMQKPQTDQQQWLATQIDPQRLTLLVKTLTTIPGNSPYLNVAIEASLIELSLGSEPEVANKTGPSSKHFAQPAKDDKPPQILSKPTPTAEAPKKADIIPPAPVRKNAETLASVDWSESLWLKVLTIIKSTNNSLYGLLRSAEPKLDGSTLKIGFRFQFHRRQIEDLKNRLVLENAIQKITGQPILVEPYITGVDVVGEHKAVTLDGTPQLDTTETPADKEAINNVLNLLGGEIIGK